MELALLRSALRPALKPALLTAVLGVLLALIYFLPGKVVSDKVATGRVSILTYNTENLFDTLDDPQREDETFLPLRLKTDEAHMALCSKLEYASRRRKCLGLDWSIAALEGKLRAVAAVIQAADNPDIVVLQEVENRRVLEALQSRLRGYSTSVLLVGDDRRGINQAVLSRLPPAGQPQLHTGSQFPGRGVLEVPLRLPDGQALRVFAVHLPSPLHPQARRLEMLAALAALTAKHRSSAELFVLAGDFNLTAEDDRSQRLQRHLRPWVQAHRWCHPNCAGTHYFGQTGAWSWLDRILLPGYMRQGGEACWQLNPHRVSLVRSAPDQLTRSGYPRPYSASSRKGASDHLPLLAELQSLCAA